MNALIENLRNNAGTIGLSDFNCMLGNSVLEKAQAVHLKIVEFNDVLFIKFNIQPDFLIMGNVMLNLLSKLPEWKHLENSENWRHEFLYKKDAATQEVYEEIDMPCVGELDFLTGKWACHHFRYHIGGDEILIGELDSWDQATRWGRIKLANFIV